MAYKQSTNRISLKLKDILKDKGLTSKEFAEMVGVTPTTISYIVTNKTTPSLDMLARMADVLNVKLSTLLGEEPLKVVDTSKEFAAYVRCKGIHFYADSIDEFDKIVDEVRTIAR